MEDLSTPNKAVENRREDGTFGPGNNANPKGRPKGKSLKEFAREYLSDLSDEDKTKYLSQLPKDIIWRMAEGNPSTDTKVEGSLDLGIIQLPKKDGVETTTETGDSISKE